MPASVHRLSVHSASTRGGPAHVGSVHHGALPNTRPAQDRPLPRPQLSDREVEVLRCWLKSDSKSEVCRQMFLAPGTINTHLARIRGKYEALGRPAGTKAALVARALQDGLIDITEL